MMRDDQGVDRGEEAGMEGQLTRLRAGVTTVAFSDGFADRVMTRLSRERRRGVPWAFARIAPLAAAAALVLAAMNLRGTATSGQSVVDRLLGLPPVTLDVAYSFSNELASLSGAYQ